MTKVNIGHTVALSVDYFDQHNNPMLTIPTPDSVPAWSDTTPAVDSLKVSADGLSCEVDPAVAGNDVVNFKMTVGGKDFSASLAIEVDPAPQVLTSVAIRAVVSA